MSKITAESVVDSINEVTKLYQEGDISMGAYVVALYGYHAMHYIAAGKQVTMEKGSEEAFGALDFLDMSIEKRVNETINKKFDS